MIEHIHPEATEWGAWAWIVGGAFAFCIVTIVYVFVWSLLVQDPAIPKSPKRRTDKPSADDNA